jgi:hypothetical protein
MTRIHSSVTLLRSRGALVGSRASTPLTFLLSHTFREARPTCRVLYIISSVCGSPFQFIPLSYKFPVKTIFLFSLLSLMVKCLNDSWHVTVLFGNYTACIRTVLLLHIADSNCDGLYCHTSTLPTGAATSLMAHPHYVTMFHVFMIYCRTLPNLCSHRYTSIFRK